jgi:predicted PurR-regulated permease PerM
MIRRQMTIPDEEEIRARRDQWWRSAFFILGAVYIGLLLVSLLVDVLGGFVQIALIVFLAWLLAFVLSPLVNGITARTGWPRGAAVGIVYAAAMIASAFLLFYAVSSIGASMGEMTDELPLIREQIETRLRNWQELVSFGRFQPDLVTLYRDLEAQVTVVFASSVGDVPQVTVAIFGSLVLVVILSLYMVADSDGLVTRLKRIPPSRWSDEVDILERSITKAFGGFLRAQVALAAIQAVLTIAVVVLLGLPYGFIIVAASTLAMLVPFFGPPLALIPPIVAVAIFEPDWFLIVTPILVIAQTVLVNWLQPRLLREALGMHPILVLVGLLVGAQIAGLWGALFFIPILAVANVFFTYLVNLRTIEESQDDLEEVIEEVRQEAPEAPPEELVALAAERVDEVEAEAEAQAQAEAEGRAGAGEQAALVAEVTEDLRDAAGDLREAAGEQRAAAGDQRAAAGEQRAAADEMGESASDLRSAADRLRDRDRVDDERR